jgi:hypothetical protein
MTDKLKDIPEVSFMAMSKEQQAKVMLLKEEWERYQPKA